MNEKQSKDRSIDIEEISNQKKTEKNQKTPCKWYINTNCRFGIECNKRHPTNLEQDQKIAENHNNKSSSCWFYLNQECKFPYSCKNMHPVNQDKAEMVKKSQYSPSGLPNLGNLCFAISAVHVISRLLPLEKISNNDTQQIMKATANLLNGKPEQLTPKKVAELMWTYSENAWPDYQEKSEEGYNIQHDCAEFLLRYLDHLEKDDKDITRDLRAIINHKVKCSNEFCNSESTSKEEELILRSTELPDNTKITL